MKDDMASPLAKLLDTYPEIKKEFDLTEEKYPKMVRAWLGMWLKKVVQFKPIESFEKIDVLSYKWTLIELRKRSFISKSQLFGAAKGIMEDNYRKYSLLEQKKEKNGREGFSTIGSLTQKFREQ